MVAELPDDTVGVGQICMVVDEVEGAIVAFSDGAYFGGSAIGHSFLERA